MGAIKYLCGKAFLLEKGNMVYSGSSSDVVGHYLSSCENNEDINYLETFEERTGNGKVKFSGFFVEDVKGNKINKVLTGDDVVFVFRLKVLNALSGKLDLGFSLHNQLGDMLSVLYSSYQNVLFPLSQSQYIYVRCKVIGFPFACNRLIVKGRLVLDGDESDWPKSPLGYVDIESGDFFGTGNPGFEGDLSFLVKGQWEFNDQ